MKLRKISVIAIITITVLTLSIPNKYSSKNSQFSLNNMINTAYASGEADGDNDPVNTSENKSAWARFWDNVGNFFSSAAEAVSEFFEWATETGETIQNTYDSARTINFNDGSYLQFSPYSTTIQGQSYRGVTMTFTF